MNAEQRQAAVDPQTKPPDLGCELCALFLQCLGQLSLLPSVGL